MSALTNGANNHSSCINNHRFSCTRAIECCYQCLRLDLELELFLKASVTVQTLVVKAWNGFLA